MAPIILSARLRGELEDLVLRTPSAKERCRAQAVLCSPRGSPPSKSPRPSRSAVRPSTTGLTASSGATTSSSGTPARRPAAGPPPFDRQGHRPLDRGGLRWRSPRVGLSCHGLDRRVAAAPLGARSWIKPPSRASAWRSNACVSAGNGPGISWRHGRRPSPAKGG